jgi:hypothetical protein
MTEEKEITETLNTVVNHPIYKKYTDAEILKLAHTKLQLSHIAKLHGLKLETIFKKPEHDFWILHITAILKHHRSIHKDTFLPSNLPSGTKVSVAEHLSAKHKNKVESAYQKLKIKHVKLESKVKSSLKGRV